MPVQPGLFENGTFRTRYYSVATTSTTVSPSPSTTVIVASRSRYLGGWFLPQNISGTGAQVEGFDVMSITGATSLTSGIVTVIASGIVITTSTGAFATPFCGAGNSAVTAMSSALLFNPGDIIETVGSTMTGGFFTHIFGEF